MNESPIWIFLFGMCSVYPFFPLRHIPVMNRLRIPFGRLMLYASVIMLVQGLSYLFLSNYYSMGALILAWHRKLFMIPYVILTLCYSKDDKSKTLFMDFFMVGIVMAVIDTTYVLDRTLFADIFAIAPHRTDFFIRTAITILIYPPLYLIFKKILRPIMAIETVSVWRSLTAIPVAFATISIITTMEAFSHEISFVILAIRVAVILGSVLVSVLLVNVVKQLEHAVKAEERSRQAERLIALQGAQYEALNRNIEQTKAARHDLRHQLAAISSMVDHKEYDKLSAFVEQYRKSVPSDKDILLCDNYAANSVMSHYIALAKEYGITCLDLRCVLSSDIGVADTDLCVLLGNLLENAIEGCKTLPTSKRKIKLRISTHAGNLMITVDNTFDGMLFMENDEILSRKRGGRKKGIGLDSVATIAEKYNGELHTEEKDGWFMASVLLVV